ncbi:MAG TPA: c-type cytochrome [Acidobacteriaceae bacterium]|jgi:cytochrome c1|nr:c-type cytochrome [Acidobacteriaceae bacterium]
MKAGWVLAAGLMLAAGGVVGGCTGGSPTNSYNSAMLGNPRRGRQLIVSYGCGSCHTIPGIYRARGLVGPPLYFFSRRTMIAGELPNNPDNLVRWLLNPRAVEPGTAMPAVGLNYQQAQDIAAYLDTLQ